MTGVPRVATIRRDCQCLTVRHEHGTVSGYTTDRCRCPECRTAARDRQRARTKAIAYGRWNRRYVNPTGPARRIRALAATGWSLAEIERRSGVHVSILRDLAAGDKGALAAHNARRIANLYNELADQPPVGTANAISKTRKWAERNGWHPPIAWDDDTIDDPDAQPYAGAPVELDEIAVERYVAGTLKHREFQRYSPELVEAVRILAGRGLNDTEISDRIGVNKRRIQGLRADHDIRAGVAA